MFVAYFDETYARDTQHAVVALVIPADRLSELERKLDSVARKAHRQHGCDEDIELHGYELSGGEGKWAGLPPRARIRIYQDAINAIASIQGAAICHGAVDLASKTPGDAHLWALTFALEQVDRFVLAENQNVLGICDDVGNKLTYQRMFAISRKHGTVGRNGSRLGTFTDGLHFTPSCYSRQVQAVDLVAYVFRRAVFLPFKDPRAKKTMEGMFATLRPLWDRGRHRKW